jgi:glycosyltransferase involved in cell wall biosynthesis
MKNLRIAHISPDIFEKSSSFIQANILGLDGTVVPFYGGYFPTKWGNNFPLELSIWEKFVFKFKNQIGGLNRAEYSFYKALKRERIDLIFTEYGPTACAIMRTIEKYKAPLLVHFHGYDVYHLPTVRKHKANYEKLISLQANAIAVSKEMKQELISWGFPSERVIYSPCGCHSRFVELQVPKERSGFIAVGRMVEKKGPLYTIKAFEMALKNGLKDNLTFIGDGPLMDTCKEYVVENKLGDYIHFLGHQSHDFVLERMLNAKVFLQHSVTSSEGDKEGTPVSVVEAMAVCMPVISTYHAGIQDVVAHGENGFLVREKDIAEMSKYILALAEDEEKCREMGNSGRTSVQKNFTDKAHLAAINDFIEKIMS